MTLSLIVLIVLLVVLLGGAGPVVAPQRTPWTYGYGFGHPGMSALGVVVITLLAMVLLGRL